MIFFLKSLALQCYLAELGKWPTLELTAGATIGWALGTLVRRR